MSQHYFMLADLTDGPHESAVVDVVTDGTGAVTVDVFAASGVVSTTLIAEAPTYFASSAGSSLPNLFAATAGQSALVRVYTASTQASSVVLRQRSGRDELVLAVPRIEQAGGADFIIPVGTVGPDTALLIGNPQPGPISLSYVFNSDAAVAHAVPGSGVLLLPLTSANGRALIRVINAGALLLVEYLSGAQKQSGLTLISPA